MRQLRFNSGINDYLIYIPFCYRKFYTITLPLKDDHTIRMEG